MTVLSGLVLGAFDVFRLGGDDWQATDTVSLPDPTIAGEVSVETAIANRRSRREFGDAPLGRAELGQLLWAMQGVTAPSSGHRAAPSAGALYPLEHYVVVGTPGVEGMASGVYRYRPDRHDLRRGEVDATDLQARLRRASVDQEPVETAAVDVVVTAVDERTTEKYGQRGERRYVPMEAGHAAENLYLQAESLALSTVVIGAVDDAAVREIVGARAAERPLYVIPVGRRP